MLKTDVFCRSRRYRRAGMLEGVFGGCGCVGGHAVRGDRSVRGKACSGMGMPWMRTQGSPDCMRGGQEKIMLNQALANWLLEPPGSAKEAVRAFAYCWTACILFLP